MTERPDLLAWRDAPRAKRQTKYANVVCEVDGIKFDSMAERQRWLNLQLLVKAKQIRDLQRQVEYVLIPAQKRPSGGVERACRYFADFVYVDVKTGKTVVEDVKGAVTPEFRIKRKLMLERHNVEILLT